MNTEEFEQFRNKAKQILGYMPIKTPCVTCQTSDEKIPKTTMLPNKKCLIRQCVDRTGIKNCAYCSQFPCDTLKGTAGLWNRKSIEEKIGAPISEKDYHSFVEPFEGLSRLSIIHSLLNPNEIVKPLKIIKSKRKIASFPENLPSKEDSLSFKTVYKLLLGINNSSLGLHNTDTFAQHYKLENRKAHILRFLWIFGNYGNLDKSGSYLVVDAETYQANRGKEKKLSIQSFVKKVVFEVLAEFGVCCEFVALKGVKNEDLTTGTGYLRKKGWVMTMAFKESIGGTATLKALQTFIKKLDKKFASRAFKRFTKIDMQILLET
jgi:hypothetical protein